MPVVVVVPVLQADAFAANSLHLRVKNIVGIIGKPRLLFAHHVDRFDTGEHGLGARHRLEAEHGSDAALDAPMILFDPIIEVLAGADPHRLQGPSRWIAQAAFSIAGSDRLEIGPAAVDDNAVRASMAGKRLAQEAFRRRQVSVFAEEELNRVAEAIENPNITTAAELHQRDGVVEGCIAKASLEERDTPFDS
jgi:hypothetical protein